MVVDMSQLPVEDAPGVALAELATGTEPVPAEQVWAELGIDQ